MVSGRAWRQVPAAGKMPFGFVTVMDSVLSGEFFHHVCNIVAEQDRSMGVVEGHECGSLTVVKVTQSVSIPWSSNAHREIRPSRAGSIL